MLAAERDALKSEAYHLSLNIVERELQTYAHAPLVCRPHAYHTCLIACCRRLNDLSMVGTQAAMLAGFSVGLNGAKAWAIQDLPLAAECAFTGLAALAFGLMMCVVAWTTAIYTLAPDLALKGRSGGAMRSAVDKVTADIKGVKRVFAVGCTAFWAAMVIKAWDAQDRIPAGMGTVVLIACFVFLACKLRRTQASYLMETNRTLGVAVRRGGGNAITRGGEGIVTGKQYMKLASAVVLEQSEGVISAPAAASTVSLNSDGSSVATPRRGDRTARSRLGIRKLTRPAV